MAGLLSIALLVGWLAVAVWIAKQITATVKNSLLRTALAIPLIAILVMLPVADEIIGGFQFRALCRENAVLKID